MNRRTVDKKAFGARVQRRRERLEMSQDQLGVAVGMQQQSIDNIEHGKVARPRLLRELAAALQTSEEWLLWKEGPEEIKGTGYLTDDAILTSPHALPLGPERRLHLTKDPDKFGAFVSFQRRDPEFDSAFKTMVDLRTADPVIVLRLPLQGEATRVEITLSVDAAERLSEQLGEALVKAKTTLRR